MLRIMTIVGARPQFVKVASISKVIAENDGISEVLVHTGQHFDQNMSDIFFEEMAIPKPDYNLNIHSVGHGAMVGRQLEAIENILIKEKPDLVLVYGDTNSTLAGSLAAAKLNIPVAHVEAGLRSFNRIMPEETNRVLTDHLSDLLFAPTQNAKKNLIAEGISSDKIFMIGDVMLDASLLFRKKSKKPLWFDDLRIPLNDFVLTTVHRAENTDNFDRLNSIFNGLASSNEEIILPLHPRTKDRLKEHKIKITENIHVVNSVSYLEMIWLENNCRIICTDSGGVQKEAYFFEKPCVTMRDETEWVELVEEGWNNLVGTSSNAISNGIKIATKPDQNNFLYGHGNAANEIVDIIINTLVSLKDSS